MAQPSILIVEDEADIAELLAYKLGQEGMTVETCAPGDTAFERIRESPPDLVPLDLMLPGLDGLELCRMLRRAAATSSIPIVMLTAKADEVDRIVGLELGADDYIVKPFSPREVALRIQAVLRRVVEGVDTEGERLSVGDPGPPPVPPAGAADLSASVDRLTDALRRRAAKAEDERRQLEEILESMSDGVLVTDRDLRVELVTPAFRAQFAARDSWPEQAVLELSRSPALVGFLERLDNGEEVAEQRIDSEAGRVLELRGRRLPGDRRVVVARDVTEQLRLDETRRDLVANVSHELRTPLTAIRGYAENLREGALEDPAVAARFIERILAQCRRLEALLEDLLALSRLEKAEEVPAAEEAIDLAALVERSLETVRGLADERQVTLGFEPQPVPAFPGSEEALDRLLLNLLENAIKYNRRGGTVAVELARQGDEVVLAVADSGIGVPQRDLPRIFERFYRVDSGRSREEGGIGLGLAIVKHAAQLHGGRVEVESELGRGSTFRVYLPVPG